MHPRIRTALDRWVGAGLIDAATAARIGAFEAREEPRQGARWPAILAWALGGILLGAGALLFVSAHWDRLSPSGRFSLVLLTVAAFHVGAAFVAGRYAALATVLHAVGTVALGAGIFLAGQIFNLQEHWPGGVMLWALGAAFGWWLLRDAAQAALLALLAPAWLIGEWTVATDLVFGGTRLLGQGLIVLAAVYLGARTAERTGAARDGAARQALVWIGGLALIPTVLVTVIEDWHDPSRATLSTGLLIAGWAAGIVLPLGLAVALRGGAAWVNGVAAVWAIGLAALARHAARYAAAGTNPVTGALPARPFWPQVGLYGWCALGSVGLVYWGLSEARRERINLGVAGFALTVVFFYFSSIMDKLGRSASLIGLGVLFLLGGWALERTRRRLIARLDAGRP